MRHPRVVRQAPILGLTVLIASGLAASVQAQHTPDPYNIVGEYNIGYENYMFPTYPNGMGFTPNEAALRGRSGVFQANQFQNYIEELDGVGSGSGSRFDPRGLGGIEPYYRAHREYDPVFRRPYEPLLAPSGARADDSKLRTEKYLEYLRESDPKRRARLYRDYQNLSLRTARDLGSGSARAAFKSGADRSRSPAPASSPSALPSSSATSRGSMLRRPSSVPAAPGRPRSARTTPPGTASESPSQILDRADSMDRAGRATAPARAPRQPAPR